MNKLDIIEYKEKYGNIFFNDIILTNKVEQNNILNTDFEDIELCLSKIEKLIEDFKIGEAIIKKKRYIK
jgi:hypothetical protein